MNEEMTDGDLIYLDDTPQLLGDNKRPDLEEADSIPV